MKIAVINKLTPEHPAWKHGKRLDVKIFTQLYPTGPQYYCGNGKYCENMEAVKIAGRNLRYLFVAYWTPTWYNNGKKEERL